MIVSTPVVIVRHYGLPASLPVVEVRIASFLDPALKD
jgi:hypothetical protein